MGYYVTFDGGSGTGKGTVIDWVDRYLRGKGKTVSVLRDNEIDPLRDYGAQMIAWCRKHRIDHQTFLLPIFVAGGKIAEKKLAGELTARDFVLRDRSFISSLAYQPATGTFDIDDIWDLYVNHMRFRVPDLALVIDTDVEIAMARIAARNKSDVGLGGQMSGDVEKRRKIRQLFLSLPAQLADRLRVVVVSNNDAPSGDEARVEASIDRVGLEIVRTLAERGMLDGV